MNRAHLHHRLAWLAIAFVALPLAACSQPTQSDSTAALSRENQKLKASLKQARTKQLFVVPTSTPAGTEAAVEDTLGDKQFGLTLQQVTRAFSAQGQTIIAADTKGVKLTARKGVQVTVAYHNYGMKSGMAPQLSAFKVLGFDGQPGKVVAGQMAGGGKVGPGESSTVTFWVEMPSFKGAGSPFTVSYQLASMLAPLTFTTTLAE